MIKWGNSPTFWGKWLKNRFRKWGSKLWVVILTSLFVATMRVHIYNMYIYIYEYIYTVYMYKILLSYFASTREQFEARAFWNQGQYLLQANLATWNPTFQSESHLKGPDSIARVYPLHPRGVCLKIWNPIPSFPFYGVNPPFFRQTHFITMCIIINNHHTFGHDMSRSDSLASGNLT